MRNTQLISKALVLASSTLLILLFIAYRTGYFDGQREERSGEHFEIQAPAVPAAEDSMPQAAPETSSRARPHLKGGGATMPGSKALILPRKLKNVSAKKDSPGTVTDSSASSAFPDSDGDRNSTTSESEAADTSKNAILNSTDSLEFKPLESKRNIMSSSKRGVVFDSKLDSTLFKQPK